MLAVVGCKASIVVEVESEEFVWRPYHEGLVLPSVFPFGEVGVITAQEPVAVMGGPLPEVGDGERFVFFSAVDHRGHIRELWSFPGEHCLSVFIFAGDCGHYGVERTFGCGVKRRGSVVIGLFVFRVVDGCVERVFVIYMGGVKADLERHIH